MDRLNVLIIPDKFKGTLTAEAAAKAITRGWQQARPGDTLELLPMSDGGDGFGAVMNDLLRGKAQRLQTLDAAHRPCRARWWWEPGSKTALVESAGVIGLAMLPPKRFHPFELDTFGLGKVIQAAAKKGAKRCIIGIGGSATNDGGFGLARALGWEFCDAAGKTITSWTELIHLTHLHPPQHQHPLPKLVVAVDVQNPLLGHRGATRVYGPQKGLPPQDFPLAESCLGRLAKVVNKYLGSNLSRVPGTGAAGGLGFGLMAFADGRLEPGFELFARQATLDRRIRSADLVITGEGAIDASTLMGKGVGQVALQCRHSGIPCIGLAGVVSATPTRRRLFEQVHALTNLAPENEAKSRPAFWLQRLAKQVAQSLESQKSPPKARS